MCKQCSSHCEMGTWLKFSCNQMQCHLPTNCVRQSNMCNYDGIIVMVTTFQSCRILSFIVINTCELGFKTHGSISQAIRNFWSLTHTRGMRSGYLGLCCIDFDRYFFNLALVSPQTLSKCNSKSQEYPFNASIFPSTSHVSQSAPIRHLTTASLSSFCLTHCLPR